LNCWWLPFWATRYQPSRRKAAMTSRLSIDVYVCTRSIARQFGA
jgi:hypothetical protein